MIVGQDRLLERINNYRNDKFPKSIIIEGSKGSGKHLIAEYIANKLKKEIIDLTDRISLETLFTIYTTPVPYVYLIDCNRINSRIQNSILKFLEEPPKEVTIILLTESYLSLLPTIVNRCILFTVDNYSEEILETFLPEGVSRDILQYVKTPGQLITCKENSLTEIINLANLIIDKINIAAISNILTSLVNKLDLTGKDDTKINLEFFL